MTSVEVLRRTPEWMVREGEDTVVRCMRCRFWRGPYKGSDTVRRCCCLTGKWKTPMGFCDEGVRA